MTVGVQIQDTDDWFPVGFVKAKDAAALETAVIRQRALIAEVSDVSKGPFVSFFTDEIRCT